VSAHLPGPDRLTDPAAPWLIKGVMVAGASSLQDEFTDILLSNGVIGDRLRAE